MTLVQAWIDSIQLLKPKNLKLFVLVTLKSIGEAYKLLLKYWWWLLIFAIGCAIAIIWKGNTAGWGWVLSEQLLLLATCLATRPSVEKKDCAYFRSHMFVLVYIAIFLAIIPIRLWPSGFSAWYVFLILFFLDSRGGPKNFFLSMWYALKMIIFNLPLLAVIGIFFYIPGYFFPLIYKKAIISFVTNENMMAQMLFFTGLVHNIIKMLLMPIGVCTYANIYIKKLHDQFDLYVTPVQVR